MFKTTEHVTRRSDLKGVTCWVWWFLWKTFVDRSHFPLSLFLMEFSYLENWEKMTGKQSYGTPILIRYLYMLAKGKKSLEKVLSLWLWERPFPVLIFLQCGLQCICLIIFLYFMLLEAFLLTFHVKLFQPWNFISQCCPWWWGNTTCSLISFKTS